MRGFRVFAFKVANENLIPECFLSSICRYITPGHTRQLTFMFRRQLISNAYISRRSISRNMRSNCRVAGTELDGSRRKLLVNYRLQQTNNRTRRTGRDQPRRVVYGLVLIKVVICGARHARPSTHHGIFYYIVTQTSSYTRIVTKPLLRVFLL